VKNTYIGTTVIDFDVLKSQLRSNEFELMDPLYVEPRDNVHGTVVEMMDRLENRVGGSDRDKERFFMNKSALLHFESVPDPLSVNVGPSHCTIGGVQIQTVDALPEQTIILTHTGDILADGTIVSGVRTAYTDNAPVPKSGSNAE
jgi:hypothetical protein